MEQQLLKQDCIDFNQLGHYLALRDVPELTAECLEALIGEPEVDSILIAGNCLPVTAKIASKAYHDGLTKSIFVAGGRGHTTDFLVAALEADLAYQNINVRGQSEAEILKQLLSQNYQVPVGKIVIESNSTNGGENASEALKKFKLLNQVPKRMILLQDPTMQRRLDASFRKSWQQESAQLINFAPFIPELIVTEGKLQLNIAEANTPVWAVEHYLSLVLGEIPRLANNSLGYGPNGKNYIAAVDLPPTIRESYQRLAKRYSGLIRPVG